MASGGFKWQYIAIIATFLVAFIYYFTSDATIIERRVNDRNDSVDSNNVKIVYNK